MSAASNLVDFVLKWCADDSHGYSQQNRWGPDCDCSSLMYMAAESAGYPVPSSGLRYTGTMRAHFCDAGFEALPFGGDLESYAPGCILLSENNHAEMIVKPGYFGGARSDEHGGTSGCYSGDQTGNEVSVAKWYIPSYGWDYVLIPAETAPLGNQSNVKQPRYRIKTSEDGWLTWVEGLSCLDACGDDCAGIAGCPAIGFEVDWRGGAGWFALKTERNPGGLERNVLGDDSPIVGLTCYYDTANPDETGWLKAKYRVSLIGGSYLKWELDDEDDFAGDGKTPIDRVQLILEPA